jgi:hypothetical protein
MPPRAKLKWWLRRLMPKAYLAELPPATEALMLDRLRVRRRARLWTSPLVVLTLALFWEAEDGRFKPSNNEAICGGKVLCTDYPNAGHDAAIVACVASVVVWLLIGEHLIRRGERRIGSLLPRRVGRSDSVSLSTIFGWSGIAFAVLTLGVNSTLVTALFQVRSGAAPWLYLAAFALCLGGAVISMVPAVRRPALAVDNVGLFLDERIRTYDAIFALCPMIAFSYAFQILDDSATTDRYLFFGSFAPTFVLLGWNLAINQPRFRSWPRYYYPVRATQ